MLKWLVGLHSFVLHLPWVDVCGCLNTVWRVLMVELFSLIFIVLINGKFIRQKLRYGGKNLFVAWKLWQTETETEEIKSRVFIIEEILEFRLHFYLKFKNEAAISGNQAVFRVLEMNLPWLRLRVTREQLIKKAWLLVLFPQRVTSLKITDCWVEKFYQSAAKSWQNSNSPLWEEK